MTDSVEVALGKLMANQENTGKQLADIAIVLRDIQSRLSHIESANLNQKVTELEKHVESLLIDKNKRTGIHELFDFIPKWVGWATAALALAINWVLEHKI